MMAVNGTHTTDANMEKVVKMQLDLIAFAFASDRARSATLQVGGCNDHTKYMINGVQAPPYHFVSHRVLSDGGSGTGHRQRGRAAPPDRPHPRPLLQALPGSAGGLHLARGRHLAGCQREPVDQLDRRRAPPQRQQRPPHHRRRGGGVPKTGLHVRSPGASHRVLNTIISAAGGRKPNGDLVDNFGDPNTPGLIAELITAEP